MCSEDWLIVAHNLKAAVTETVHKTYTEDVITKGSSKTAYQKFDTRSSKFQQCKNQKDANLYQNCKINNYARDIS